MRIAVTGATGFIGSYLLDGLMEQGEEVAVVGRHSPPANPRINFIETDLLGSDGVDWIAEYKPTHLLHLAWYAEHGQFWESPLNWDWCNATERLARAFCKYGGQQLIIAGTCAEYDWSDSYCKENETPINPATTYGKAKEQARQKAQQICYLHNVAFAWGRIFYPFGPGEDRRRLIPAITDALLDRLDPFPINIGHWRDFMPVQETAGCFRHILNHQLSGAYNVSSGTPIQIRELIERIADYLDSDPAPLLDEGLNNKNNQSFLVGDNTALSETGWTAESDIWNCLKTYVAAIAASR